MLERLLLRWLTHFFLTWKVIGDDRTDQYKDAEESN